MTRHTSGSLRMLAIWSPSFDDSGLAGALLRYWRARHPDAWPLSLDPTRTRPGPLPHRVPGRTACGHRGRGPGRGPGVRLWDSRFHVVPAGGGPGAGSPARPGASRVIAVARRGAPRRPRDPPLSAPGARRRCSPSPSPRRRSCPSTPAARCLLLALQGPVLAFVVAGAARGPGPRRRMARPDVRPAARAGPLPGRFRLRCRAGHAHPGAGRPPGRRAALPPDGAEPLASDGDLDLTDDFAGGEYSSFYSGAPLRPHLGEQPSRAGSYSIHSPGLALLILPALRRLRPPRARSSSSARWPPWPACSCTAWCAPRWTTRRPRSRGPCSRSRRRCRSTPSPSIRRRRPSWPPRISCGRRAGARAGGSAIGAAAAAGALAWLHSKFVPLGALGLVFTLLRPCAWRVRAAAAGLFAAMVAGVLWYFHALYGIASSVRRHRARRPRPPAIAAQRGRAVLRSPVRPLRVRTGLADGAARGRPAAPRASGATPSARWPSPPCPIAAGAAYVGWWGGAAPPARYLVPALARDRALRRPRRPRAQGDGDRPRRLRPRARRAGRGQAPRILHNRADGESLLLRNLAPGVDLDTLLPVVLRKRRPGARSSSP